MARFGNRKTALNTGGLERSQKECDTAVDASESLKALVPQPLDAEGIRRRQDLEDIHEELLLTVLSLEEEWMLDDRIAYSLRQRKAA